MSVDAVVAQVAAVLARAESLFAGPTGEVVDTTATHSAATASAAISGRTVEMSGSFAAAHRDLLGAAGQQMDHTLDTDARLTELLARSAETHAGGRARAVHLRSSAEQTPSQLQPWAELPVSDIALLRALRHRVADMAQLLADHRENADRVAGEIRSLQYRP